MIGWARKKDEMIYQGSRIIKKPKFKIGDRVKIRDLSYVGKVTHSQYRSDEEGWVYKVDGKSWYEHSLVKATKKMEDLARKRGAIKRFIVSNMTQEQYLLGKENMSITFSPKIAERMATERKKTTIYVLPNGAFVVRK